MTSTYQVNEIFYSIQGEGVLTGTPCTFIRLQGCTVGCPWCDTKYTWQRGGTRMTPYEIGNQVQHSHVVITGGEPTLYNLDPLIRALWARGCYVQLETSGQQWLKGEMEPNWITLSPKATLGYDFPLRYLKRVREVKWVVDEDLKFGVVWQVWQQVMEEAIRLVVPPYFVLMPEGCPPRKEMVLKALSWLEDSKVAGTNMRYKGSWRYGDRIQYRIGVR